MSQALCRIFTAYTQKSSNEREQIIFKETYDFLIKACRSRQPVSFKIKWGNETLHTVLPYSISVSKEELFNYLLCQEYNSKTDSYEAMAYRLNRIEHPITSSNAIPEDPIVRHYLEMMKFYGPQYSINDDDECCVRLTAKGVELFNRIYFGRPVIDRIKANEDGTYYYYFKGSKFQLLSYFRRFDGGQAIILYPANLRDKMISEYRTALSAYTSFSENHLNSC